MHTEPKIDSTDLTASFCGARNRKEASGTPGSSISTKMTSSGRISVLRGQIGSETHILSHIIILLLGWSPKVIVK